VALAVELGATVVRALRRRGRADPGRPRGSRGPAGGPGPAV